MILINQTGVDRNKRQETGMKKSPRWRIAIALSALSIIFVSAALAGEFRRLNTTTVRLTYWVFVK